MADDAISSLRVNISADLSELQAELGKIPALMAAAVGSFSGEALSSANAALDATTEAWKSTGDAAGTAAPHIAEAAQATEQAGHAAASAAPDFEHLDETLTAARDKFVEFLAEAGLTIGVFEGIKEALSAFSQIQNVTTSLGLLAGNSETASKAVEDLKDRANDLGIPLSNLLSVAQRLAPQFGVGTDSVAAVIQAAADAAAGSGRDFDAVAGALQRVAITGMIGARQLNALGISMEQIAETMGKSVPEATELLKKGAMDATTDVEVLVQTIEKKFPDAAALIAQNLSGQFERLKNTLHELAIGIGTALDPLAEQLLGALNAAEPALVGIAGGAALAATGLRDMAEALAALVPDFVKMILSGNSMIALGTAIGFVGAALAAVVQTAHAAVLQVTDLATGNLPQFINDFKAAGPAMQKAWVDSFQQIAQKGDELQQKLKDIGSEKIPIFGDTVANSPLPTLTNQLKAAAEAKKALEQATTDLAKAEGLHAQYLTSSYVPSIMEVEAAEQRLHDAKLMFLASDQAIQSTEREISDAKKAALAGDTSATAALTALEAKFAEQVKTNVGAHIAYTEAVKDLSTAKSNQKSVTEALQAAENAIAASDKSSYTPAILDHTTALQNLVIAEQGRQDAINAVITAENNLTAANAPAIKDATAIKDAEDALKQTERDLAAATTVLAQARKDETTSASLLTRIQTELDAGEKSYLATRKLLLPVTTDITKATRDYTVALASVKAALADETEAEAALRTARDSGRASGQQLIDLEAKAKASREAVTVATKSLGVATGVLTNDLKVSRDTLDDLKKHTEDWSDAQKKAAVELDQLGVPSLEHLATAAKEAEAAYDDLAQRGFPNATVALEANVTRLQDAINYQVQLGADTTDLRIRLDAATEALHRQTVGFSDLAAQMKQTITGGLQTAFHDLLFDIGSVGDAFKKLGESMVDVVVNRIIKDALSPLLDVLDSVIAKGVKALESVMGIGVNAGGGVLGTSVGAAGGAAGKIGGTIAGSGEGAAGGGLPVGIGTAEGAGAGSGEAGGATGGSAASSALGGVMGVVGAVGSVVSAISGIIGNFQAAETNSKLAAIEGNTRVTAILMGAVSADGKNPQDTDNIKYTMKKVWQILSDAFTSSGDIWAFTHGTHAVLKDEILPTLQMMERDTMAIMNIAAGAKQMAFQQTVSINISGASDPKSIAQAVADYLKTVSPVFT